jgi:hypothetical protein
MKRSAWTLSALVAFLALPMLSRAADESKSLTGEPVDIKCYLGGKMGEAHAACAETCAKGGQPVGLLVDESGKKVLYLVIGDGQKKAAELVAGLMGKKVTAMGKVSEKDGLKVLTVTEVKAAK